MKSTYKLFIVFAFCAVCLSSCFDGFLEEEVYDFLSPSNFYKTEADAIAGVNGIYNTLVDGNNSLKRASLMIGEYPSESSTANASGDPYRTEFEKYTWGPTTAGIELVWKNWYTCVSRSNRLLASLPNIDGNQDVLTQIESEAKFMRALAYFYLIRLFDHIPFSIDAEQEDYYLSNEGTDEQVWNQIIEDLKFAEAKLPESYTGSDMGRATSGAAKAILAKVYLTMGGYPWKQTDKYALAASKCEEIISSGIYSLEPDYADVFTEAHEHGSEYIFAAEFQGNMNGSNWVNMSGVRGQVIDNRFAGWSAYLATTSFYNNMVSQNAGDLRMPTVFILSFNDSNTGELVTWGVDYDDMHALPHTRKYTDINETGTGDQQSNLNVQIMRFADVLLMHSEAVNNASGFSGTYDKSYGINLVRSRAGLDPVDSSLSKEAFNDALIWERVVELCFEGQIWYDYKRMEQIEKRAALKGLTNIAKKYYVFPIPQNEIDRNVNLRQHSAWQ